LSSWPRQTHLQLAGVFIACARCLITAAQLQKACDKQRSPEIRDVHFTPLDSN
jgi:hypothetical protein